MKNVMVQVLYPSKISLNIVYIDEKFGSRYGFDYLRNGLDALLVPDTPCTPHTSHAGAQVKRRKRNVCSLMYLAKTGYISLNIARAAVPPPVHREPTDSRAYQHGH